MQIGMGLKAHSGWAVLVAVGETGGEIQVVDRRRIELVDPAEASWAKQPYHAGERLSMDKTKGVVQKGIAAANREARQQIKAISRWATKQGHQIAGCGILVGSTMPNWTIDEIFAVHVRMHKAEGVLFPQALAAAARALGLRTLEIPEKDLTAIALERLSRTELENLEELRREIGPPWGKDQKSAAMAALIAVRQSRK